MSAQRDAALSALYESYWYTQRLEEVVQALEDPMSLAYVEVAISALDKLDALLKDQQKADERQHHETHRA